MSYEGFREKVADELRKAANPLTWTEVRTAANLPQAFPNNQWVRRMEEDIGLLRRRSDGIIHWLLKDAALDLETRKTSQTPNQARSRPRGKQGAVE